MLTIAPREGSFPGIAATRQVTIILHEGGDGGDVFEPRVGRSLTYAGRAESVRF